MAISSKSNLAHALIILRKTNCCARQISTERGPWWINSSVLICNRRWAVLPNVYAFLRVFEMCLACAWLVSRVRLACAWPLLANICAFLLLFDVCLMLLAYAWSVSAVCLARAWPFLLIV